MRFKCGPCDRFSVQNEATAFLKGEFSSVSEEANKNMSENRWYAQCSMCGAEWGPCSDFDGLQKKMIEEGVLIK